MADLIEQLLDEEEGDSGPCAVPDSRGYLTLGRGICVDPRIAGAGLPQVAIDAANKVRTEEARKRATTIPGFIRCNEVRQAVLVSMCFQLGSLTTWHEFRGALVMDDYEAAAAAGLDSEWAKQTPARAQRQMAMLSTGKWIDKHPASSIPSTKGTS